MYHIEDLVRPGKPLALYKAVVPWGYIAPCDMWLPSLPVSCDSLVRRVSDAWAVFCGRAVAVQWPHQREVR